MVYRPTVRYSDVYAEYMEKLADSSGLERTQLIRCALFAAVHTEEFQKIINEFSEKDQAFPAPVWSLEDHSLWLELDSDTTNRKEESNELTPRVHNQAKEHGEQTKEKRKQSKESTLSSLRTRTSTGGVSLLRLQADETGTLRLHL
ncbi:hypothetical protein [Priestia koreensis]|uniref:hypothetical protein n=1 Tax=Priestia koreensis TaxID=284581 RepID=UPI0006A966D1|nr:hypothetical protein [Priestia koreensis]